MTGRRISDKIISSSASVDEVILGLEPWLKKPKNVGKTLAQRRKAGRLPPNVFVSTRRVSEGDNDEALGRKKTIHAELYNRGLVLPKKTKTADA